MKIRIKFKKYGSMKFIGHLDFMRYFQKAMIRGNIDIAFSGGFSPHQIMSFASPLGVGVISDGEYFDIEVGSTKTSTQSIEELNHVMAEGVEILEYKKLSDTAKNAMSIVAAADYELSIKAGYENPFPIAKWKEIISEFKEQAEIIVLKKTKKSEKEVDIKPLIYHLELKEKDNMPVFVMQIATGSSANLKPELVLEALAQRLSWNYNPFGIQIKRLEVYAQTEKNQDQMFIPLGALGVVIEE